MCVRARTNEELIPCLGTYVWSSDTCVHFTLNETESEIGMVNELELFTNHTRETASSSPEPQADSINGSDWSMSC